MDSSTHTHRALTAGLSIGGGIALSAVAFAATIPFEGVHEAIAPVILPLAAGSIIGVGIHAVATAIDDHVSSPEYAAAAAERSSARATAPVSFAASRQATPKGVPVIARAQDALSEAEAWAEIDSLLTSDSPVSCDPLKSKDIYEIALEEMARGTASADATAQTAYRTSATAQGAETTATMDMGSMYTAPAQQTAFARPMAQAGPEVTATYMRIQQVAARAQAQATAARAAVAPGAAMSPSTTAVPMVPVVPAVFVTTAQASGVMPTVPASSVPSISLDMGQAPASVPQAVQSAGTGDTNALGARVPSVSVPAATTAGSVPEPEPAPVTEVEVPMVDYSGHEGMWAEALAILAEEVAPAPAPVVSAPVKAEEDEPIEKIFDGLDKIPASFEYDAMLEDTDGIARSRMGALAEGANATGVHSHVNEILNEELGRVPSQSVRTTGREYLRVIQGGTMAMPRYTAEA